MQKVVDALKAEGVECKVITGAGTGTYPFEASSGLYTEVYKDYLRI